MNMETNKDLEKILRDKLSLDELELQQPDAKLILEARKKIMARKKTVAEPNDFFSFIAAFLNFRVKLYQAVLAMLVISGGIMFYNSEGSDSGNERTDDSISNIASVRSSTVLSSIYTFGVNKKPYDGRTSN